MRGRRFMLMTILAGAAASGTLVRAGQQGVGQTPSGFPLSGTVRERGSSVTGAYEGWYYGKDGNTYALVGYFNRNTKQEFDIPVGPNNRIEPGGPDQGQPTHFLPGRQWGLFAVKLPKDLGTKRLTWTIVANGFTNTITLHTQADYIVEPYEDAANKNTPPKLKFDANGPIFTGPPTAVAAKYTAVVGTPLPLTVWATDEGPKINVPEPGRGRGRGAAPATAGATGATASTGATGAGAATTTTTTADAPQGRGGRGRGAGDAPGADAPQGRGRGAGGFGVPLAVTWSWMRGPAAVKFDNAKPSIATAEGGKATTNATFSAPGDYLLRIESNDSTGSGGGGFQCCWTTAYVAVNVKAGTP